MGHRALRRRLALMRAFVDAERCYVSLTSEVAYAVREGSLGA